MFKPRVCFQASTIKYNWMGYFQNKSFGSNDLNINSLLPKIDELRHMAKFSNAAL